MRNRRRVHVLSLAALLAALCVSGRALAQAPAAGPPQPIPLDIIRQVQPDQAQIDRICAYTKYWGEVLNDQSSTPADIERARDALIQPLNQPNAATLVAPGFRGAYSRCAIDHLEQALNGGDIFRATNALLVLSQLGTDRAANALLMQADIQNQSKWQIRVRAADGVRMLLQGSAIEPRKATDAARKLRDAVGREDNGLVVRRLLDAMHAADLSVTLPVDHATIRAAITEALTSAARRIVEQDHLDGPMLNAVAAGIGQVRQRFTDFTTEEQRSSGAQLGPAIGKVLEWSLKNWDKAHEPSVAADAQFLVGTCEGLLQSIFAIVTGRNVAPPAADRALANAWRAGDKAQFEAGVKAWQAVLSKPPYKQ